MTCIRIPAATAAVLLMMLGLVTPVASLYLSTPFLTTTTLSSLPTRHPHLPHSHSNRSSMMTNSHAFATALPTTAVSSQRLTSSITSTTTTTTSSSTTSLRAVEGDFDPDAISKSIADIQSGSLQAKFHAFYKFTRPHTIRGTILASIAGTTRALIDTTTTPGGVITISSVHFWEALLPRALVGMIALLLGNAFIVGINQIYDKEIDVLNKPFLPVASGEMSVRVAWGTVLSCGILGPVIV